MNKNDVLEGTLQNILCTINPLKEDWSKRFQFIAELRAVVQAIDSLRDASVEPYGSFVSDLFTRRGDLDISIELSNASEISISAMKKLKENLLKDVLNELRTKGGYRKLKLISNARVPILMFQGKYNISCDLSVNNLVGQMKSKLLYWISLIDSRFRNLVLLVKEWAKTHNINDSKRGTLNSYSLCLLVIFHFQTCVPRILPPLKEIYPGNMVDDLKGVREIAEKNIEEKCAVNINQLVTNRLRVHNQSSLSQLFISFLTKIEDPFEQPVNTARGVNIKQLARISETFKKTCNMLESPNQDPSLLISTLVCQKASTFLARSHGNHSREAIKTRTSSKGNTVILSQAPRARAQPGMQRQPNSLMPRPAKAPCANVLSVQKPKSDK